MASELAAPGRDRLLTRNSCAISCGSLFELNGSVFDRPQTDGICNPAEYTFQNTSRVRSMLIHELNGDECREILARSNLGRLACARYGQPYVVPIHFSFDSERNCVYAFSTIGQKIEWMRDNPKVCLEVEEIGDKDHWTTVLAIGRYEEIHQNPDEAEARRRAEQLFLQRREWWLPGAAKLEGREHPDMVVYRINIDRLTGRRAARGPD